MRESLTILACLLILILAAAFAGPYLADWNAQRSFFAARLSELIGEEVHLNGGIDLKLLPIPYLEAANIAIGSPDNPFSLTSGKVRLELSLPPLLRGEFAFTDVQLKNPVLRLKLDQIAPETLANPPRLFKFERISLDNATITLENIAPGKTASLQHLQLEAQADSLLGPFNAKGSWPFAGLMPEFALTAGAVENGKLDLKLNVEPGKNLPKIGFAGGLFLAKNRLSQSALSGQVQFVQNANLPWTIKANLSAGLELAKLDSIVLQWGDEPMGLTASGDGSLTYDAAPKASLNLKIGSLDLDRFLGADPASPEAELAPQLQMPQKLKQFLEMPCRFTAPLPVNLTLAISNLLVSDARFSDISASILFSQNPSAQLRAEGYGADRARLSFDGSLETGSAANLAGQIEWASPRPADLPDFIEQYLPSWSKLLIKTLVSPGPLDASGAISLTRAGLFAHNLNLRQGAASLSGTLDYLSPGEAQRGRLFAALTASRIDVQAFSPSELIQSLRQGLDKNLDLSLRFNADAVSLHQSPGPPADLAKVKLRLLETGQDFKLEEFEFSQSGGISFRASGEAGQDLGHLNVSFDAAHPAPFARLLSTLWPFPFALSLANSYQEQNFAPAHARFSADANRQNGQLSLQNADLDANLGATKFHAFLEREENTSRLKFDAAANAPEATALWQQIGLPIAPAPKFGPGNFTIAARSKTWGAPIETEIHAADSSTSLDFSGVLTADPASPKGTGEFDCKSKDITPYLLGLSKSSPGGHWIAWPQQAGKLPLNLGTSLHWDNEAIKANHLAGEFGGVGILGELSYARHADKALLEGNLDLDEYSLGEIFSLGLGAQPSPAKGQIWPDAPFGQGLKLPFETKLTMSVRNFVFGPSLSGQNTRFELGLSPQTVELTHFSSTLAGGMAAGDFLLHRQANMASLEAKGELQDFQTDLPFLHGKLGMKLNFAGSGMSILGLVKSLAGGGEASLKDAVILRSDPKALRQIVMKSLEDSNLDHDQLNTILDQAFSRSPLIASKLMFDLNLSDGHLRFGLPASQLEDAKTPKEIEVTSDFDLAKGWLAERTKFSLPDLPKGWLGPRPEASLSFHGPLNKPAREIDTSSLSNALDEQEILKESERIANFEFDLHERAFFYERLRSERRREQDKLKLRESLQDKGEEDRRRAAELAHSEHLRRDDQKRPAEEERSSGALIQQSGTASQPKSLTGSFGDPSAAGH